MPQSQMVYVVDDDEAVRGTVRTLCRSIGMRVEEFASIHDFETGKTAERGGCILLDLRMPRLGGLPGLLHVRGLRPQVPVIVMSGHADVRIAVQVMKAGAVDFFEKPFNPQELLDSIQDAISRSADASVSSELKIRLELLTPQQWRIMERLSEGRSEADIATELKLHPKSIQRHRTNALSKLQLERGQEFELKPLLS